MLLEVLLGEKVHLHLFRKVLFYFLTIVFEFSSIRGLHIFSVSKKLFDDLSLDVSCMVTSLKIANPNWWIHNAQFACINVGIILCDFSFRANLHVMRYLGFGIDIFERIIPSGLFILNIFNLLNRFLFSL